MDWSDLGFAEQEDGYIPIEASIGESGCAPRTRAVGSRGNSTLACHPCPPRFTSTASHHRWQGAACSAHELWHGMSTLFPGVFAEDPMVSFAAEALALDHGARGGPRCQRRSGVIEDVAPDVPSASPAVRCAVGCRPRSPRTGKGRRATRREHRDPYRARGGSDYDRHRRSS